MRVEMQLLNRVKYATSAEQKAALEQKGYKAVEKKTKSGSQNKPDGETKPGDGNA